MILLKKRKKTTIALITFLLFTYPIKSYTSPHHKINIKYWYDCDTCITFKEEKIRLACIDTPEMKSPKADSKKAKKAKDFLNNLIANNKVLIISITKDKHGRTGGKLFKNGSNIKKLIID